AIAGPPALVRGLVPWASVQSAPAPERATLRGGLPLTSSGVGALPPVLDNPRGNATHDDRGRHVAVDHRARHDDTVLIHVGHDNRRRAHPRASPNPHRLRLPRLLTYWPGQVRDLMYAPPARDVDPGTDQCVVADVR